MPAFCTVQTGSTAERAAGYAYVQSLSGGYANFEYAEVLRIEQSSSVLIPTKAFVSIRNKTGQDDAVQLTLDNDFTPEKMPGWSRIRIVNELGNTIFIGNLQKRDELVGNTDTLVLEYWDDRWFLAGIPLIGCLVYDRIDGLVKVASSMEPRMNPDGYRNCCMATIPGLAGSHWVFTRLGDEATQTLADDNAGTEGAEPGTAVKWTVLRALKYARLVAHFQASTAAYGGMWPNIDTTKINWPVPAFESTNIDRAMPDMPFKGKKLIHMVAQALDVTGCMGFKVDYGIDNKSVFGFCAQTKDTAGAKKTIYLQRSGTASDIKTQTSGVVSTDYSEFRSTLALHGAPFLLESEFLWTNTAATSTLHPAWTRGGETLPNGQTLARNLSEEYFFMQIVIFALDRNGNAISGLTAGSIAALNLARISYPKVFRAYEIRDNGGTLLYNDTTGIMRGSGSAEIAAFISQCVKEIRPIQPSQLQPYFEEAVGAARGRTRIPVRIQLSDTESGTAFHDVTFNNGLRVSSDGLIWFDGLTDDLAGNDNLYTNLLLSCTVNDTSDSSYPKLRKIKLNATVVHDCRLQAYRNLFASAGNVDVNEIKREIEPTLIGALNGTYPFLVHYILNQAEGQPGGFTEEHQVASQPALSRSLMVSDGNSPAKLTALVTPVTKRLQSDQKQAEAHVARRFREFANVKRAQQWSSLGMRYEFSAGDFVEEISLQPSGKVVKVNAPILTYVLDFEHQESRMNLGTAFATGA